MATDGTFRRRHPFAAAIATVIAGVIATQLGGCEADYEAPLAGGFSVVRTSADSIGLYGPSRTLERRENYISVTSCYAGPLVDGVDVIGSMIVGHARQVAGTRDGWYPGYFVIDSSTNEHWLELTKDEFDARCKSLGIVPDLKPPSYFKK